MSLCTRIVPSQHVQNGLGISLLFFFGNFGEFEQAGPTFGQTGEFARAGIEADVDGVFEIGRGRDDGFVECLDVLFTSGLFFRRFAGGFGKVVSHFRLLGQRLQLTVHSY